MIKGKYIWWVYVRGKFKVYTCKYSEMVRKSVGRDFSEEIYQEIYINVFGPSIRK